ncbi:MAG: PcfJ domain-containing protein [Bacteroidia bacterium]
MGKKTKQIQTRLFEKEQQIQQIIQNGNQRQKNPLLLLSNMYQNTLTCDNFPFNSSYYHVARWINGYALERANKDRKKFYEFLQILFTNRAEKMLGDEHLIKALYHVSRYQGRALRDLKEWRMPCHNPYRAFGHLLRHLFAEYEVPVFMDNAFFEGDDTQIGWYMLLARGGSLRRQAQLPIPLNAKATHLFLNAPITYKVYEAMRYAQVMSMGGDEKLVHHLLATNLASPQRAEAFWETVIRFFIQNPMLDPVHIAPIIDCIQHKKFAPINPEMPNFEMKGRTVSSILRMVETWHTQLNWAQKGRIGKKDDTAWVKFNLPDFVHYEGKEIEGMTDAQGNPVFERKYSLVQLISASELQTEGKAMNHCVASYAHSCKIGNTSIWSFTLNTLYESKRLLTIELNKHRGIVQIRGKHNARANDQEMRIIRLWAMQAGLQVSKWV